MNMKYFLINYDKIKFNLSVQLEKKRKQRASLDLEIKDLMKIKDLLKKSKSLICNSPQKIDITNLEKWS